jgi:3-oxoacyl-[acyl-carrier protein] reductase
VRRGTCALVVEAPTPVGAAVAERLVRDGWPVVLHHSDDEAGAEALAMQLESLGGRAVTLRGSFASPAGADGLFTEIEERWGPVLVLVTGAAGVAARGPRDELAQSVCALRRALEPMRAARFGRVVQLASSVAPADPGDTDRLAQLATAIAPGLGRYGVTVNTVAPGVIDGGRRFRPAGSVLDRIPARRAGTPEEVAACVCFLASADAAYVTAQVLFVDGGMSATERAQDGSRAGLALART